VALAASGTVTVCLLAWLLLPAPGSGGARAATGWVEDFERGRLDAKAWVTTGEGDFRERLADVVDIGSRGLPDRRLRLRADTMGTRDDTVKFVGVRCRRRVLLTEGAVVSATLD
jgi:hypothetical protein